MSAHVCTFIYQDVGLGDVAFMNSLSKKVHFAKTRSLEKLGVPTFLEKCCDE
jgi:hypothetical protein